MVVGDKGVELISGGGWFAHLPLQWQRVRIIVFGAELVDTGKAPILEMEMKCRASCFKSQRYLWYFSICLLIFR